MGPWLIRDAAHPFRPGCSFETLKELIQRGRVTRDTIIRGPTTRQFWNFAGRTPGIANLLGICHNCFREVKPSDYSCASCGAVFTPETDRQHMGLAPVHLLPGQASPEIIAASAAERPPAWTPAPVPEPGAGSTPVRRTQKMAVAAREDEPVDGPPRGLVTTFVVIGLLLAGVVGSGAWWLANRLAGPVTPVSADIPPASEQTSEVTPPPVNEVPASSASDPEPAPSETVDPAPQPEPAPEPPQPEEVVNAPAHAAEPDDAGRAVLTALVQPDFDAGDLIRRLEAWKARDPAAGARADGLASLVRARAQQRWLRTIP